ncbi:MAG TPA: hypothetical protein VGB47_06390 [Thermoanaerobaculia bacterium]
MPEDSRGDRPHGPAPASELNRGDRSHGPAPASEAGHETSDVSIRPIVRFGIGLGVATALISVALWGLFRLYDSEERKQDRPLPPMVAASLARTPPEPRLEPDPLAPRRRIRAREDAVLTTYGWVDRSGGVVRIPIDRAMELLVQRGLPPSKPPTPVPSPRPGHGTRDTGQERVPTP